MGELHKCIGSYRLDESRKGLKNASKEAENEGFLLIGRVGGK